MFPIVFVNNHFLFLQKYAQTVNAALDEFFPEDCKVDIIAEPGMYYMQSAGTVVACIIGKHQRRDKEKENQIVNKGKIISEKRKN